MDREAADHRVGCHRGQGGRDGHFGLAYGEPQEDAYTFSVQIAIESYLYGSPRHVYILYSPSLVLTNGHPVIKICVAPYKPPQVQAPIKEA